MSDSDSSSSGSKSRSRSRSRRKSDASSHASASERSSRSWSRSRDRYSRSRSRSHRRHSRSRSRRKRSSKYDRSSGSRRGRQGRRERSASPFSSRRRHYGDRDNPRQSRCLGVFGLSLYTQERELRDIFERFGPVEDVQIVYDHQTGRSRGFAFVYMKSYEDAAEAKDALPGTEIDGHKIRVDYSITNRPHTPTPGVYLGRPTTSYRRSNRSSPHSARRHSNGGRRSPSYSRSYSRSPRRY